MPIATGHLFAPLALTLEKLDISGVRAELEETYEVLKISEPGINPRCT